MIENIEKTGEMLIRKHKEKGGVLAWHKNVFKKTSNTTAARNLLIELGLIKWSDINSNATVLTPYGWNFENFIQESQKPKPEVEKMQLELILLRNQVFDYSTTKSQAKWGVIIAAFALILAALDLLLN